jgi:glycosyltransferase involved in cell wall biosynthesis
MRVALTCPTYWPYVKRGERFVNGLARYLAQKGQEVEIITSKPGRRDRNIMRDGVTVRYNREYAHPLLSNRYPYHMFAWSCFRSFAKKRHDVIQSLFYIDAFGASCSKRFTGVNHIFYIPNCDPFHWGGRIDKYMFERAVRSSVLMAPSRYLQEVLKKQYGCEALVVPPGVDTSYFRTIPKGKSEKTLILCVAELIDERKRIPLLLKAFERFKAKVPDAVLVLSGRTNTAASRWFLKIVDPAIRSSVWIPGVGKEKDFKGLYARATMTVLPSRLEPFGMVLVESLAAGTPVVAARSGGVPEIVDDPLVGVLFEETETPVDDLYRAMLQCLELTEDPATSQRCVRHSQRYDWEIIGPRFEQIYKNLAGNS